MGLRVTDEVEAAGVELGPGMLGFGFYSYGEMLPIAALERWPWPSVLAGRAC
jgi:hypothetical protein